MCRSVVCFDLDDTLYKEIDFVESAFVEIASSVGHPYLVEQMMKWFEEGKNVFQSMNGFLGRETPIDEYIFIFRNHIPKIVLSEDVENTLNELRHRGVIMGLISDGRSSSQRNKINALMLDRWIQEQNIIISEEFGSEKPDERNFCFFQEKYPDASFTYVGDNTSKDFIAPNLLHWNTIMLKDDGRNIHKQVKVPEEFLPKVTIDKMIELLNIFR